MLDWFMTICHATVFGGSNFFPIHSVIYIECCSLNFKERFIRLFVCLIIIAKHTIQYNVKFWFRFLKIISTLIVQIYGMVIEKFQL